MLGFVESALPDPAAETLAPQGNSSMRGLTMQGVADSEIGAPFPRNGERPGLTDAGPRPLSGQGLGVYLFPASGSF
jgi:hypothetical protein